MRLTVHVQPRARRNYVGGRHGTGEPAVLAVRVAAAAVDGKANVAVIKALARAFDVPASSVQLRTGHTNRTKVVDIDGADPLRLDELLRG